MKRLDSKQLELIGDKIVELMRYHKFTVEQLAFIVGMDVSELKDLCLGKDYKDYAIFFKIAKALGVEDYELTGIRDITPYLGSTVTIDWNFIADTLYDLTCEQVDTVLDTIIELEDNISEGIVSGNYDDAWEVYKLAINGRGFLKAAQEMAEAIALNLENKEDDNDSNGRT